MRTVALVAVAILLAGSGVATREPMSSRAGQVDEALVATYDADIRLAWASRRLRVATRISVRNDGPDEVSRVDLNTLAARLGDIRGLDVRIDGLEVVPRVTGQTLRVPLPTPLAQGSATQLRVSYRARLRATSSGRDFLWSRAGGVAHIYRFIPWLSRRIPFGPALHGEPFLTATSPYVRVDVDSDRALVWATSGERIARRGRRATYVARNVRDFNIAASPGYRTRATTSHDGRVRIVAFTLTLDPARLLRLARAELARFQKLTGVTYPYAVYRVAESGGGLAMESPALIWIPRDRSPADQAFLVSHETAHQWFYSIVGNDQSSDPFADEAPAEFLSRSSRGALRASACARDRLDRGINGYRRGCYYETVYVQGALFLEGLRRDFGEAKFWRAIRTYAEDRRLGIGGNSQLLEAFRAEMGNKVLKRYRARFPSLY